MAIIEHPTSKYSVPGKSYYLASQVAKCDLCHTLCTHTGSDPGDAAEQARKRGWGTQKAKGAQLGDPKIWVCKGCIKLQQQPQP